MSDNFWSDVQRFLLKEVDVHFKYAMWQNTIEEAKESVDSGTATVAQQKLVAALQDRDTERRTERFMMEHKVEVEALIKAIGNHPEMFLRKDKPKRPVIRIEKPSRRKK